MSNWSIVENTAEADYAYVSKKGNDTTGDGSKNNPYKTIEKGVLHLDALTGKIRRLIIGTGLYINEAIGARTSGRLIVFIGDGSVVFDGTGNASSIRSLVNGDQFYNIKIQNYTFSANPFFGSFIAVPRPLFTKCVLVNNPHLVVIGAGTVRYRNPDYVNCLVVNSKIGHHRAGSVSDWLIHGSTFINCVYDNDTVSSNQHSNIYNNIIIDCTGFGYFSESTPITTKTNNNIIINSTLGWWNGSEFENKSPEWMKENTVFFQDYKSDDPLFTNGNIGDYTLKPESPALYGGENGGVIGPFGVGLTFSGQQLFGNRNLLNSFGIELLVDAITMSGAERIGMFEGNIIDLGRAYVINTAHIFSVLAYAIDGTPQEIIDYETDDFNDYIDDGSVVYYEGDTCTESATKYRCNKRAGTSGAFNSDDWDDVTNNSPSYFYDIQLQYSLTDNTLATGDTVSVRTDRELFAIDETGKGSSDRGFDVATKRFIRMRYFKLRIKLIDYTL